MYIHFKNLKGIYSNNCYYIFVYLKCSRILMGIIKPTCQSGTEITLMLIYKKLKYKCLNIYILTFT